MAKDYLDIAEINRVLDELKSNTDNEMDVAVIEDTLNDVKIMRIAAERMTIRRIKSIFNQAIIEANDIKE